MITSVSVSLYLSHSLIGVIVDVFVYVMNHLMCYIVMRVEIFKFGCGSSFPLFYVLDVWRHGMHINIYEVGTPMFIL